MDPEEEKLWKTFVADWEAWKVGDTKLGEIMSMGLPVVCNSGIGDVDEIVRTMNAGIVIDVLDTEHFDVAARQLLNTAFSKTDITAAANTYFSLKKGVVSYRKIYETL